MNRDRTESGLVQGEQGLAFIDEAYAEITGQSEVKLDEKSRQDLYNAMQSLDPDTEGFSLDDCMRTMISLAAWNKESKPAHPQYLPNQILASTGQEELTQE